MRRRLTQALIEPYRCTSVCTPGLCLPALCVVAHTMRKVADMSEGTTQADSGTPQLTEAQPAREIVVAALGRVESGQRDALEELRVALCGYVGALGRSGWTRDQVLQHIRDIMANPVTPAGAYSLTPVVREALAELTLEWCRTEYARIAPV